jgi:serine/threonine-protein kinase
VDRRTDVFALGIVLYQITTGTHPYRGDNDLATLRRICDKTPAVPPRMVVPGYPPALDQVIAKAVAKDRADRWATMAEMMAALEAALPPERRSGSDELAMFMRDLLGARGEARRQAIRDAIDAAEGRSGGAPADAAAASSRPPSEQPPSRRSSVAPPSRRSEAGRRSRREPQAAEGSLTGVIVLLVLAATIAVAAAWYVRNGGTLPASFTLNRPPAAPPPPPSAPPSASGNPAASAR